MSDNLERAENHIRLGESTSNPQWGAAHALLALALIAKEFISGRS